MSGITAWAGSADDAVYCAIGERGLNEVILGQGALKIVFLGKGQEREVGVSHRRIRKPFRVEVDLPNAFSRDDVTINYAGNSLDGEPVRKVVIAFLNNALVRAEFALGAPP